MNLEILTSNLLDGTLVIALFSGFFYFLGSFFDPDVKYNRYASGFIISAAFILLPAFLFFFFHYDLNQFGSSYTFGILFVLQILLVGVLIFVSLKPQWILKIKKMRDNHPMNLWILLAIYSWIMIVLGLECSVNFNPYSSFVPQNNFEYVVKAFFVGFPVIFSIAAICLILVLASGKPIYPHK